MKVVQINVTCGSGSTGNICLSVSELLSYNNVENYIIYSAGSSQYPLAKSYMSRAETKIEALKSRVLGNYGFNSKSATKRLILLLERISPDIVHLHNLHGHNCNLSMLLDYLTKKKIKIYWTFHDCWSFTGYCTHYDMIGCQKWLTKCEHCPQKSSYSWFFDKSKKLFEKKKELVSLMNKEQLTVVAPSWWIAKEAKRSFFKDCEIRVIHNGIDTQVFKPANSDIKKEYGCYGKYLVLGVAYIWNNRKGLDVFCRLAKSLPDDYRIILVGLINIGKADIPDNIITINRTSNVERLTELYTEADVFVNPTREEVLGLTNLEALACGTPVVTFNTGGCPECVNEKCGYIVDKDDYSALEQSIRKVCEEKPFNSFDCIEQASHFEKRNQFQKYIDMYREGQSV